MPGTDGGAAASRATRVLRMLALCALLHAPCAMAGDLVRYRLPDGSIGFALDRSEVPPGAVVLPPPEKPKGSLQTGQAPPSRRAAQPSRAPRTSGAAKAPPSGSTEQRYNEARKRLRQNAEDVRRRADAVRCEHYQRANGRYRRDCRARARAKKNAEERAAELEREREELIDACMEDDSCTPGLVMDDDEREEPEEEEPREYRGPQRDERDDHDVRDYGPPDHHAPQRDEPDDHDVYESEPPDDD